MNERWPTDHGPALRWLDRVDRTLARVAHPEHGSLMSLTNALEYQVDQGAHAETFRHLVAAFSAFTSACGIDPASLGLEDGVEALLASIAPKGKRR